MFRRILVMTAACLAFGACLALAGKVEKEGYTIMPAADGMSVAEMRAALETLGLHVERFAYEVPVKHSLRLEINEYRDGKLVRQVANTTAAGLSPGAHRLLIFARRSGDSLQFSFSNSDGEGGGGGTRWDTPVSLDGLRVTGWDGGHTHRLVVGQRAELCHFRGDRASGRPSGDDTLKEAVAGHDVVVAVFATLERPQ